MFRKETKQICTTCKGSGIDKKKPLTDKAGRTILAPTYEKGEGSRPQYVNCKDCQGSGFTMQPTPDTIMVDGEKVQLNPEERKQRYDVAYN